MGTSRSPQCKVLECVVHFGIEIWVSSKQYRGSCDDGGGDAGQSCTKISVAA